jgi:hypothetical protein
MSHEERTSLYANQWWFMIVSGVVGTGACGKWRRGLRYLGYTIHFHITRPVTYSTKVIGMYVTEVSRKLVLMLNMERATVRRYMILW